MVNFLLLLGFKFISPAYFQKESTIQLQIHRSLNMVNSKKQHTSPTKLLTLLGGFRTRVSVALSESQTQGLSSNVL